MAQIVYFNLRNYTYWFPLHGRSSRESYFAAAAVAGRGRVTHPGSTGVGGLDPPDRLDQTPGNAPDISSSNPSRA